MEGELGIDSEGVHGELLHGELSSLSVSDCHLPAEQRLHEMLVSQGPGVYSLLGGVFHAASRVSDRRPKVYIRRMSERRGTNVLTRS